MSDPSLDERARLQAELRQRQQQMKMAMQDVRTAVRQSTSPSALLRRAQPLAPYALAATIGYLLLRLRGRGPRLAVMVPMAFELWRLVSIVRRGFASPVARPRPLSRTLP